MKTSTDFKSQMHELVERESAFITLQDQKIADGIRTVTEADSEFVYMVMRICMSFVKQKRLGLDNMIVNLFAIAQTIDDEGRRLIKTEEPV